MIGQICGLVMFCQGTRLEISVGGVGYEVDVPEPVVASLKTQQQPEQQQVTLFTHLSVREDAHLLYGFISREQRDIFRILIKTSGIGPRLALTVLSYLEVPALYAAVRQKNSSQFVKIPGIGKKTAEKLLLDLVDRLPEASDSVFEAGTTELKQENPGNAEKDALDGLIGLGFPPDKCKKAINFVKNDHKSVEKIIEEALKVLSGR